MTEYVPHMSKVEHVRLRPGMYFGGKDKRALHNVLFEALDDSIAEIEAGHGDHIWITLGPDSQVTIRDNGRGLPVHMTERGVPMLYSIMVDGSSGRVNGTYEFAHWEGHKSAGLVGVNALASELDAEVATEGGLWRQSYRAGVPIEEVTRIRDLEAGEPTGTTLSFRPDFTIFEPNEFDYAIVSQRARDLAALHPNTTVSLEDRRESSIRSEEFHFPRGLIDFVAELNRGKPVLHDVVYASDQWTIQRDNGYPYSVAAEVAIQYTDTMDTSVIGFANNYRTTGGFHIEALLMTLRAILNGYTVYSPSDKMNFSLDDVLPGLTAVVKIKHPEKLPSYDWWLTDSDVSGIVIDIVNRIFPSENWVNSYHPTIAPDPNYDRLRAKCRENRQKLGR